MKDAVIQVLIVVALVAQPLFLVYFLLYNTYTLVARGAVGAPGAPARGGSLRRGPRPHRPAATSPSRSRMIVPAYNEEVTIVDSVTSLVHCDYPRHRDRGGERRLDRPHAGAAQGRAPPPAHRRPLPRRDRAPRRCAGCTRRRIPLPAGVMRVVVIDKENGGKADALNAGINASTAPYFVSLDADSILDEQALKELMRVVQEDPRVVAVGGQVAIANGCTIRNSRVVSVGLPARSLARFQMVEYLRSFTTGRTGLDRMRVDPDPERGLRGVREGDRDPGRRLPHAVRPPPAHRGIRRRRASARSARTWRSSSGSTATCATSCRIGGSPFCRIPWRGPRCPRRFESLRKQRGRWYRGLRESLRYHRAMMCRRKFGRIGWFALPAFWVFEYWAPWSSWRATRWSCSW